MRLPQGQGRGELQLEPFRSTDRSPREDAGRRGRLYCPTRLPKGLRGNPGAASAGLSGPSLPPAAPRGRPHAPPAATPARGRKRRAPPRSPALSRVLCRLFGEGGGGAEVLLQWGAESPARAWPSVKSHDHIKMPYKFFKSHKSPLPLQKKTINPIPCKPASSHPLPISVTAATPCQQPPPGRPGRPSRPANPAARRLTPRKYKCPRCGWVGGVGAGS